MHSLLWVILSDYLLFSLYSLISLSLSVRLSHGVAVKWNCLILLTGLLTPSPHICAITKSVQFNARSVRTVSKVLLYLSKVLDPFLRSAISLCSRSRSLEWRLSTPSTAAFWASTWVAKDSAACFKKAAASSSSWLWHFISAWVPPSCPPPSNSTTSSTCVTSQTYSRYIYIYIY